MRCIWLLLSITLLMLVTAAGIGVSGLCFSDESRVGAVVAAVFAVWLGTALVCGGGGACQASPRSGACVRVPFAAVVYPLVVPALLAACVGTGVVSRKRRLRWSAMPRFR